MDFERVKWGVCWNQTPGHWSRSLTVPCSGMGEKHWCAQGGASHWSWSSRSIYSTSIAIGRVSFGSHVFALTLCFGAVDQGGGRLLWPVAMTLPWPSQYVGDCTPQNVPAPGTVWRTSCARSNIFLCVTDALSGMPVGELVFLFERLPLYILPLFGCSVATPNRGGLRGCIKHCGHIDGSSCFSFGSEVPYNTVCSVW